MYIFPLSFANSIVRDLVTAVHIYSILFCSLQSTIHTAVPTLAHGVTETVLSICVMVVKKV